MEWTPLSNFFYDRGNELFHPLLILSELKRCGFSDPSSAYFRFQDTKNIVPASFRRGEIDSVMLHFRKKRYLMDIESDFGLSHGTLRRILHNLPETRRELPLEREVIEVLFNQGYIGSRYGKLQLGLVGRQYVCAHTRKDYSPGHN